MVKGADAVMLWGSALCATSSQQLQAAMDAGARVLTLDVDGGGGAASKLGLDGSGAISLVVAAAEAAAVAAAAAAAAGSTPADHGGAACSEPGPPSRAREPSGVLPEEAGKGCDGVLLPVRPDSAAGGRGPTVCMPQVPGGVLLLQR